MSPRAINEITAPTRPARPIELDEKSKVRLQKAVKDFEAIFVGYLIKSMRSSVTDSGMFGESFGGDIVESMFDLEFARHIARSSNLGIGEMIYRQVTGEALPKLRKVPVRSYQVAPPKPEISGKQSSPQTVEGRIRAYDSIIEGTADRVGVSSNLIRAIIAAESAGVSSARSSKDAKGLMQLMDSTAAQMGVRNVWNPRENIAAGTKYLKHLLDEFQGDLRQALASYNAGPGAVKKHSGVPPYQETKDYIRKVMDYLGYYEQKEVQENDSR